MKTLLFYLWNNLTIFTNDNGMNTLFISIAIFIVGLNLGLIVRIEIEYDLLKNLGKIGIRLFGVKLFKVPFTFVDKYLQFTTKKRVIKLKIDFTDKKLIFFEKLGHRIKSKLYLDTLNFKAIVCGTNPLMTALAGGASSIIVNILQMKLQLNHTDALIHTQVDTGFRHNYLQLFFETKLMISLFDILSSTIITLINMWSINHAEKQEKFQ